MRNGGITMSLEEKFLCSVETSIKYLLTVLILFFQNFPHIKYDWDKMIKLSYVTRLDKMSGAEQEIVDLSIDDVKVGLEFDSYNQALASILKWSQTNYIPLIKRSTRPGNLGSGGTPGRIQLYCTKKEIPGY